MTLTEVRQISGSKGGQATLQRHGLQHFQEAGSKGGRPRRLTLAEMRAKGFINTPRGGLQDSFKQGMAILMKFIKEEGLSKQSKIENQ
jgi:general stress protein YciG